MFFRSTLLCLILYVNYLPKASAQDIWVSSGPHTVYADSLNSPFGQAGKYIRTQYRLTASELRASGALRGYINSIAFATDNQQTVYVPQIAVYVSPSISGSDTVFQNIQNVLPAYQGSIQVPDTGWFTVVFTHAYYWDGVRDVNIQICVQRDISPLDINIRGEITGVVHGFYSDIHPLNCTDAHPVQSQNYIRPVYILGLRPDLPDGSQMELKPATTTRNLPSEGIYLRWRDSGTGGEVQHYNILLDTVYPPQTLWHQVSVRDSFIFTGILQSLKTYYWQVIPTNSGGSALHAPIAQFTTSPLYCTQQPYFPDGTKISSVRINTRDFYTGDTCTGYTLHMDTLYVSSGDSCDVKIQRGSCSGFRSWYAAVGIDLNADGDFSDTTEICWKGGPIQSDSVWVRFKIPACSDYSYTRLRCIVRELNPVNTMCQPIGFGETEDILIRFHVDSIPERISAPVSNLSMQTDVCPDLPEITWHSGRGVITGYEILLDTVSPFVQPDTFISMGAGLSFRIQDTLIAGQLYYHQIIPFGPGGKALYPLTDSFRTSLNICSGNTCSSGVIYPFEGAMDILPSAISVRWINDFYALPDSIRIVWDTLNPPQQFYSPVLAGYMDSFLLKNPVAGDSLFWQVQYYDKNGVQRNCPSVHSFSTRADWCKAECTEGTSGGDFISRVRFAQTDHISGPLNTYPFYARYDSVISVLQTGSICTFRIQPGTYPSGNYVSVWLDHNRNGIFDDLEKLGETLINAPAPSEGIITAIIPACADTGYTLLRIREVWGVAGIGACETYPYGETEDYIVKIVPALPAPPDCPQLVSPVQGFSNIYSSGDSLRWMPAMTGTCPDQVEIFLGTQNPPLQNRLGLFSAHLHTCLSGNLQPGQKYYWTAVAMNSFGQSQSCPVDSFMTCYPADAPQWMPVSGLDCDRMTLNFLPVAGVPVYQVQIASDSNFNSLHPLFNPGPVSGNNRLFVGSLHTYKVWYARVRSINICDTGIWSIPLRIELPANPDSVQVSGNGQATCHGFKIQWGLLPGVQQYELDVALDSSFTQFLTGYQQLRLQGNEKWIQGLRPSRRYFVRIRALNTCGAGPWSVTRSYQTQDDIWLGMDANWSQPWNWCSGYVPDSFTNVQVFSGRSFMPEIHQTAYCKNIQIHAGAELSIKTQQVFSVFGNWVNYGRYDAGSGTTRFVSDSPQFYLGQDTFYHITLQNFSGLFLDSLSRMVLKGFLQPVAGYLHTRGQFTVLADSVQQGGILRAWSPLSGVAGKVNFHQRFNRFAGGRMLSTPFYDQVVQSWWTGIGGSRDVRRYIESAPGPQNYGFQILSDPGDSLSPGTAYVVQTPGSIDITLQGEITTGTVESPLTWVVDPNNRAATGWNLAGNPFLCPVNWDSPEGWFRVNLSNAIFIMDPASGQQASYINGVGTLGAGPVIPPGQGFWVKAFSANPRLLMDERIKTMSSGKLFRENAELNGYRFTLQHQAASVSESVIRFHPLATEYFDDQYDAEFPGNLIHAAAPQIWLEDIRHFPYSILSLNPEISEVHCRICMELPRPGIYSVNVGSFGYSDFTEGELLQISELPEGVRIQGNDIINDVPVRFCPWSFQQKPSDISTNGETMHEIRVYPNPIRKDADLNWHSDFELSKSVQVEIRDIHSRLIYSESVHQNYGSVPAGVFPAAGIYYLSLTQEGNKRCKSILFFP